MTPDEHETRAATGVINLARLEAMRNARPMDVEATTIAILVRALEIATHGMSPERRAGLFYEGNRDERGI